MGADCRARRSVTPVLTRWPQPHSSARGIPLPHGPDLGVSPAPAQPCVHRWVLVCAHTAGMRMCVCARALPGSTSAPHCACAVWRVHPGLHLGHIPLWVCALVRVAVRVHRCASTHVSTSECQGVCDSVSVCVPVRVCLRMCLCTSASIRLSVALCVCVPLSVRVCLSASVCPSVCAAMCLCIPASRGCVCLGVCALSPAQPAPVHPCVPGPQPAELCTASTWLCVPGVPQPCHHCHLPRDMPVCAVLCHPEGWAPPAAPHQVQAPLRAACTEPPSTPGTRPSHQHQHAVGCSGVPWGGRLTLLHKGCQGATGWWRSGTGCHGTAQCQRHPGTGHWSAVGWQELTQPDWGCRGAAGNSWVRAPFLWGPGYWSRGGL